MLALAERVKPGPGGRAGEFGGVCTPLGLQRAGARLNPNHTGYILGLQLLNKYILHMIPS